MVFDDNKIPTIDENVFVKMDWSDSLYETELPAAPINMTEPLGNPVIISVFVDADNAGNVITRRSQTGTLIYVNNAPIIWYTKKQNTVEAATYGSESVAARIAVEMADGLYTSYGCLALQWNYQYMSFVTTTSWLIASEIGGEANEETPRNMLS
jgi:hypothetical protein